MSSLGPITTTLEEELKQKLRQRNLVIWLDKDGIYTPYVDELVERHAQGSFFAPVVSFRGSYLEMLLALENYGDGLNPDVLLIHMPGHTEETIRKTPILELYRPGYRYRKAFDTLIREAATGKVSPDEIEGYLSNGVCDLAQAEQWLATSLRHPKGDLNHLLESLNLEWILDGLIGAEPTLKSKFEKTDALSILAEHLNRHVGLDVAFLDFYHHQAPYSFSQLGEALIAWLMSVEYVHDLTRAPHLDELKPLQTLSTPLKKTCDRLIQHLRQQHPERYASTANVVESRLEQEWSKINPDDLGKIDTFQQEERVVLEQGALKALERGQWDKALEWAQTRLDANSFWLQRDRTRRLEWTLIQDAAVLGSTVLKTGRLLESANTLRDALDAYTERGYQVDLAHRHFEQQRSKLLVTELPHFNQLQNISNQLAVVYRTWADELAIDFAKLCESEGFLPEADLQQRTLYEQVIHPLTQSNAKVAYFLIDAFRYEMATELLSELEGTGTKVALKARYAELPSITAVGMNVLAPVSQNGRLTLAGSQGFKGFKTGEYAVSKPEQRVRAMGDRSVDNVGAGRRRTRGLTLSEVCDRTTESLKKSCSDADLIVVHSKEIDDAGEANVGIVTFERWIQQLKSAWNHLRSIGVNEFVFTADHGFLLQDQTTLKEQAWGKKIDPKRRYALIADRVAETHSVTVSFSELKYEGQEGYLLFPRDTAIYATGNPGASFVHGGNSLQERIIPVLSVTHRNPTNLKLVTYQIEAKSKTSMLGCSRIEVRVIPAPSAQGILGLTGPKTLTVALRIPGRQDILINLKDAPDAVLKNQQVELPLDVWVEILFDLKGAIDDRVKIEIYHPDLVETVESLVLKDYFDVAGSGKIDSTETVPQSDSSNWQDSFEDEAIGRIFIHLQQHGVITEVELTQLLGNPRQVRRFSQNFESYLPKVPFPVRIETTGSGKRYVKDL
jgi:hypothetical protein